MTILCACGKQKEETVINTQKTAIETDGEHIYNLEDIALPVTGKYSINHMGKGKDYFFLIASMYESEKTENKLFKLSLENGEVSEIPLELDENESIDNLVCDTNDNVYIFKAEYASSESDESKNPFGIDELPAVCCMGSLSDMYGRLPG